MDLECRVIARLATGDRTYYWADVVAGQCHPQTDADHDRPLTEQQFIAALPPDRRAELKASRLRDISAQRPLLENWREKLPDSLRWPASSRSAADDFTTD